MEEIMGQIEYDVLYGDVPAVPTTPAVPAVQVSPTGVVTKNPNAPRLAPVRAPAKSPVKSAIDFLRKPAGPLPVYGWGLIGLGAATAITVAAVSLRRGY